MAEIIGLLDRYFYWPEHNFDRKRIEFPTHFAAHQIVSVAAQDLQRCGSAFLHALRLMAVCD